MKVEGEWWHFPSLIRCREIWSLVCLDHTVRINSTAATTEIVTRSGCLILRSREFWTKPTIPLSGKSNTVFWAEMVNK